MNTTITTPPESICVLTAQCIALLAQFQRSDPVRATAMQVSFNLANRNLDCHRRAVELGQVLAAYKHGAK